ncbi:endonuclease/exonuclease/phosphatase family protein [Thauera sp. WH-1]|uniref:endonuclease/exonuclease/phosphatase family protein n=1 Tax=Thauera sp. WH-1 TaxID=3398230 RepID=UPI0039FBA694
MKTFNISSPSKTGLILLMACAALLDGCAQRPPGRLFEIDAALGERVERPHAVLRASGLADLREAALLGEDGSSRAFAEDHLIVSSRLGRDDLERALRRWQARVVDTHAGVAGEESAYLVRIDPSAADLRQFDARLRRESLDTGSRLKVSSRRGLQLLAASFEIDAVDGVRARPVWLDRPAAFTPEQLAAQPAIADLVRMNCARELQGELRQLVALGRGGPQGAMAEAALRERYGSAAHCSPQPPEMELIAGGVTVLPPGQDLEPYRVILSLPAGMSGATGIAITAALGEAHEDGPTIASLFGGSVQLRLLQDRIGVATQFSSGLPACAQSESFTLRVSLASGSTTDFAVRLPIRFGPIRFPSHREDRSEPYPLHFTPGVPGAAALCVAGDPQGLSWSWVADPDALPAGLALSPSANTLRQHRAELGGTPAAAIASPARGAVRATQAGHILQRQVEIDVGVRFHDTLGGDPACGTRVELEAGAAFRCELPRPRNIPNYTWSVASGALPTGLALQQTGGRWYVAGTVPENAPVRGWPLAFRLQPSAHLRPTAFVVTAPVRIWTQNAQLRPSGWPTTANRAWDNEERATHILNRIRQFDVVALQEVFDDDQRDQLAAWAALDRAQAIQAGMFQQNSRHRFHHLHWGPVTEELTTDEESGLALFVRTSLARGLPGFEGSEFWTCHSSPTDPYCGVPPELAPVVFGQLCAGGDCWARKGFTITKVPLGEHPDAFVWLINTHMQASEDDGSGETLRQQIRRQQLDMILQHIDADRYRRHPVILLGDTNVRASEGASSEYRGHFEQGPLQGWLDAVQQSLLPTLPPNQRVGPDDDTAPFTWDQERNAYAHFWDGEGDHRHMHVASGLPAAACRQHEIYRYHPDWCAGRFVHPCKRERLDHILVRQGSALALRTEEVRIEDAPVQTRMCNERFPIAYHAAWGMQCYLSDHFGLSARFRLLPAGFAP